MIELAGSVLGLINARPYVKLYMPRYIHGGITQRLVYDFDAHFFVETRFDYVFMFFSLKITHIKKHQVDFSSFNKLVSISLLHRT